MHLREAYDGLTDVHLRIRAANALGRALLFTSSPADGAAVAREAAARRCRPSSPTRRSALRGLRADGRAVRRARPRGDGGRRTRTAAARCGRSGEKLMGAVAALEWTQTGGHVDEVVPLALARARGRRARASRDPNLLTLAALLPMIVGDRDEALQIFDLGDARRAPPRLAVRGHRHVPVARVHAVLARRPDRRRGGAARVLRPGRGVGLRRRTRCSGTPRTSRGA